jgi:hypothetical protein
MPSLYIPSLLDRQKAKYWERICAARDELARFEENLDARLPQDIAEAVRLWIHPHLRIGKPAPYVPLEGQAALAEARRLIKAENSLTRRLDSPMCCYMERLKPPYVVWCYGMSWDDIDLLRDEDGKVTLAYALRLLDVLLNEQPQVIPTRRQIKAFDITPDALDGWDRLFWQNRRRLVRFLRMAAKLEEDLLWGLF